MENRKKSFVVNGEECEVRAMQQNGVWQAKAFNSNGEAMTVVYSVSVENAADTSYYGISDLVNHLIDIVIKDVQRGYHMKPDRTSTNS